MIMEYYTWKGFAYGQEILEAMRIRGYDIDIQELERYDRVFQDAK